MKLNMHLFRAVMTCAANFATSNIAIAQAVQPVEPVLNTEVQQRLDLNRASFQSLEIPAARGPMVIDVTLGNETVEMELFPVSNRADDFVVSVDDGSGVMRLINPPAETTFRGAIRQWPGSNVAATITDAGLKSYIIDDAAGKFGIQPAREVDPRAGADAYVVYHADDLAALETACGLAIPIPLEEQTTGPRTAEAGISCNYITEIAFDADVEFYQLNNSSVVAVIADIESIVNGMNVIYDRDVQITHVISRIIVRTSENDGYTSTNPNTMIEEMRAKWNAQHRPGSSDPVHRDTAHLMTGKNIDGSTIGIAYLGAICSSTSTGYGYGLSQSRFSGNYMNRVALTSHEVGHNWNAGHCNGASDCGIMCSGIGGCTGQNAFGAGERDAIISFRNTRSCITNGSPAVDCNANCIADSIDIATGFSNDCNGNQVPDECDPCRSDLDGSGAIDVLDLFAMLSAWGNCPPNPGNCACPADMNDDNLVNVTDLFVLLSDWGACN